MTNPFLRPDRVPPPSTRVLTPGTAQPYYPGDPAPGTAPLPATGFPGTSAPPATAYPGSALPAGPITPTSPATSPGFGPYGPRAEAAVPSTAVAGDSVQVPSDQQQTRFASAAAPANVELPKVAQNVTVPTPIPAAAAPAARPFTPHAGAQAPIQQAAYDETPTAGASMQQLRIREVTPAEYEAPTASAAIPTRDGFRPQSSEQKPEAPTQRADAGGFRPPGINHSALADGDAKFGVGPSQEWLRGQLEYWPQSGEWSIKYMPDGQVDQIGGRILIDNPQVLGHLPPGEMVKVEGQVFGRQIDEASYRPAYRVAVVQRQQK